MKTNAVHLLFAVNVGRKVIIHQLVQTLLNVLIVVRTILRTQINVKSGKKRRNNQTKGEKQHNIPRSKKVV